MKKTIAIIALIFISTASIWSQSNSLYFNKKIYQSTQLNPARQPDCRVTIALPVISEIYIDFKNTGFAYKNFFKKVSTSSDSLKFSPDINGFYDNLKPLNYQTLNTKISFGSLAFWIHDFYLTLDASLNNFESFSYPKSLFLIKNGNYFTDGSYISATNLGFNFNSYLEYSIGLSKEIIPGLTIGAKIKFLSGIVNFNTKNFQLDWHVSTADTAIYDYTFNTSYTFRTSSPLKIKPIYDSKGHLVDMQTNSGSLDPSGNTLDAIKQAFKDHNNGFAVDLGIIYNLNNKFEFSASILDLGFIKWKNNPYTFTTADNSFVFSGLDPEKYIGNNSIFQLIKSGEIDSILNNYQNDMIDTVAKLTQPDIDSNTYSAGLNTKFHLGAAYTPNDWFNIGILYNGMLINNKLLSGLTLSSNLMFWRGWSLSLNYNIFSNSYNNVGVGFSYKIGPFQSYILMDNVAIPAFGIRAFAKPYEPYDKGFATKWLKATKMFNIQFGLNFVFGCRKRYDIGLID